MMKDLEVVDIDGIDYFILKDILHKNVHYLYLVNVNDNKDMMIRKAYSESEDIIQPLSSDEEFDLALALMFKK